MYCGSNKTALASQKQIAEAMMRLISVKPYREITISELCRQAGISRQTFYTLFTSRENVMVFTLQTNYRAAPQAPRPDHAREDANGLRQLCRGYSEYIQRNKALLKLLVENQIDYLLYDSLCEALEECGCFLSDEDPCTRRYAASFYAGGVACVARRYAQEGCTSSADQLERLLTSLFSGRWY